MKHIIWILILWSSVSSAKFKHLNNKNYQSFWTDYIVNPAKQIVPEGQKYGPFKPEVMEEIKASPEMSRYFAAGMVKVYLLQNFKDHSQKFEKKFGTLDIEKKAFIANIVTESVYAEDLEVIKKIVNDVQFRNELYLKKLNKVLELKSLK